MDVQSIPATFLRLHTRDLLERVKYKGERFLVETFGRPMVVLISYDDYLWMQARMVEQSGVLAQATETVRTSESALQGNRTTTDELEGVVPGGASAPPSNEFTSSDYFL